MIYSSVTNTSNSQIKEVVITSLENGTYSNDENLNGVVLSIEEGKFSYYNNSILINQDNSILINQGEIVYKGNNSFELKGKDEYIYKLYAIDHKNIFLIDEEKENMIHLKKVTSVIVNYGSE